MTAPKDRRDGVNGYWVEGTPESIKGAKAGVEQAAELYDHWAANYDDSGHFLLAQHYRHNAALARVVVPEPEPIVRERIEQEGRNDG